MSRTEWSRYVCELAEQGLHIQNDDLADMRDRALVLTAATPIAAGLMAGKGSKPLTFGSLVAAGYGTWCAHRTLDSIPGWYDATGKPSRMFGGEWSRLLEYRYEALAEYVEGYYDSNEEKLAGQRFWFERARRWCLVSVLLGLGSLGLGLWVQR